MRHTPEQQLAQMSLDEKLDLVSGHSLFTTSAIARLGVRSLRMADGSNGLRVLREAPTMSAELDDDTDMFFGLVETGRDTDRAGPDTTDGAEASALLGASYPATCFPAASVLACGWNEATLYEIGSALARECRARDVDVLLGPGVNIRRSARAGRSFEYYSEDPVLSADMAAAMIRGLQDNGVAASLKHFACNNSETERITMDSVVEERALREVYLAVFERVIARSNPWTVMTAYNRLNGIHASENAWLLTDILRGCWGYGGVVMSDWHAIGNRPGALEAGCDLDMPLSRARKASLRQVMTRHDIAPEVLDHACLRLLRLVEHLDSIQAARPRQPPVWREHHALAVRAAAEGCVLLRNTHARLPLQDGAHNTVLVIGTDALCPQIQGAGSAAVNAWQVDQPLSALRSLLPHVTVLHEPGWCEDGTADPQRQAEALQKAARATSVVIFASTPGAEAGEDADRKNLDLLPAHNALIERVCRVNPAVAVVVITPDAALLPWRDDVQAIVAAGYAGQGFGLAVAELLCGKRNFSGKLSTSWPEREADAPAFLGYPGEQGRNIYREGIFVGYRYFDRRDITPLYPFGFGLSYTTFHYGQPDVQAEGQGAEQTVRVRFWLTNTGTRPGREIWQLYIGRTDTGQRESRVSYPVRVLRAFGSVTLEPGESREVEVCLSGRDFAYFDCLRQDWCISAGAATIEIGASSRDIRLRVSHTPDSTAQHFALTVETPMSAVLDHPAAAPVLRGWLMDTQGLDGESADMLLRKCRRSFLGLHNTLAWSLGHEPDTASLTQALCRIVSFDLSSESESHHAG
ncbi:MAG: glycoside hydrolase family 3 C-terminal domain-containing protein [Acetobacter sp.]|uniref:beta-glucosidase n=1 Tax=Acetobacter sp. TaxID=440 RepID=UPI0039E88A6E